MTHPPQNTVCQGRTTATGAWRDSTATATTARKDHWATKTHISLHFITIQGWSMVNSQTSDGLGSNLRRS